jgi:hypothetical protein
LFDHATHKVFASRDVFFHEQDEGNHDDNSHENGRDFLMKELKKSSNRSIPHSNNHPHSDIIINNKD